MFLLAISFLLFPAASPVQKLMMTSEKKILKKLESIWPEEKVSHEAITSSILDEGEELYLLRKGNEKRGFLILDQASGKYDLFDYMVVFDMDGRVREGAILVYREAYGGEISGKRWLKQFIGKGPNDSMSLNDDISGISGATISCRSATSGIKDLTEKIAKIKMAHGGY